MALFLNGKGMAGVERRESPEDRTGGSPEARPPATRANPHAPAAAFRFFTMFIVQPGPVGSRSRLAFLPGSKSHELIAVQRCIRPDEQLAFRNHWRRHDALLEFVRRQDAPFRSCFDNRDDSLFAGRVDQAVARYR